MSFYDARIFGLQVYVLLLLPAFATGNKHPISTKSRSGEGTKFLFKPFASSVEPLLLWVGPP